MHPRTVDKSILEGFFPLPIGIRFLQREVGDYPRSITVSTVCLDDGHLEDPLKICEPETGFETMIFLDGCTFFSIYTAKYKTREEAQQGHQSIIKQLDAGTLPLAISLHSYSAHASPMNDLNK